MFEVSFIRGFKPTDTRKFEDGTTINEIVMEYNPVAKVWAVPVVCLVNNTPVLRKDWDVALKESDVVEFLELPMGGGGGKSNPLQLLLTVVLIVAAALTGYWIAGLYGDIWGSIASAVVMMAGGLLLGAIFKGPTIPTGHQNAAFNETASPTYGLNASNNQARLYQPIGEGFGRIKIVPDRVAQAYTKYSDNEFYLYQVFGLGRGSYRLEALSYGDNVFWKDGAAVSGYEVEVEYYETGQPVTLFPDNVEGSVEVSGQQIYAPNDEQYDGPMGPFTCNPPGTVTEHIVCNLVFSQGLGYYNNDGNLAGLQIDVEIHLRMIDDFGAPLSDWIPYVKKSYYMATLTPQRFSVEIFPARGRWECKMFRTNNVGIDGRTMQALQWESLYSYIPGTLTYNQATLAVRTKATNILSQSAASTFGVVYTRLLPEYDPETKTWSEPRPTRKFAAAMSSVLRSQWGGNLPDRKIDLDSLWGGIDQVLTQRNWTFDGYFDGAYSVFAILMEMCQAFRVVPRLSEGGVTFVYDQPKRPIRHIFTPRDILRGSLSIVYNTFTEDTPDNILWNYLDEDAGYQQREVRCALPDTETVNPVIKSFIGVVNRRQAFEMGVYQVACNRHRRVQLRFSVEAIGRLLFMGDVCAVTHPYFCAVANGAVKDWDKGSLSFDLGDAPVGLNEGREYYLTLNKPDGRPWGPCKAAKVEGRTVTLDGDDLQLLYAQGQADPFGFADNGQRLGMPTAWTLQEGKEFAGRVIIQSVIPSAPYIFEITAINDSDNVDDYWDLPVPPWHYRGLTDEPITELLAPTDFEAKISGDALNPEIELFWKPIVGATFYDFDLSVGDNGEYESLGKLRVNYNKVPIPPGRSAIRIRGLADNGVVGPYGSFVIDTQEYFGDPVDIEIESFEAGNLKISWSEPDVVANGVSLSSYTVTVMNPATRDERRSHIIHVPTPAPPGLPGSTPVPEVERVYEYTKEMALADGGLLRSYLIGVKYTTVSGTNQTSYVTANDAPPRVIGELNVLIGANSITLNSITVEGEHTGFVVVRGDAADFALSGVAEMRETGALPFEWTGLEPDTEYYFRIAAKDGFADLTLSYMDLLYSGAMAFKTLAE
jgi:hypothetical protein